MLNSSMTTKGQVTIPASLRERLGLKPGDKVAFVEDAGKVILKRVDTHVDAAFGLIKTRKTASLDDLNGTISDARARRARR